MAALAGQALRLRGGAAEADLRRLAVPALEFAQHVPALAGALDLSVREAVAAKLMLIPGVADRRSSTATTWITATMGPQRDGPPAVVTAAGELSVTARRIAPALRRAGEDLLRHATIPPTPARKPPSPPDATPARRAYSSGRPLATAPPASPPRWPRPFRPIPGQPHLAPSVRTAEHLSPTSLFDRRLRAVRRSPSRQGPLDHPASLAPRYSCSWAWHTQDVSGRRQRSVVICRCLLSMSLTAVDDCLCRR